MSPWTTTHVKFTSGQSVSSVADIRGLQVRAISVGTMDGVDFEFDAAEKSAAEGGVFRRATSGGGAGVALEVDYVSDRHVFVVGYDVPDNCFLRLVSTNGSGTPVVQSADRDVVLFLEGLN